MANDNKKVECSIHGKAEPTFICQHLTKGEHLGFNVGFDPDEPDALYPDAWCDRCEDVLDKEGEWNDNSEAFADIKLVCSGCYCEIRAKNWIQDDEAFGSLVSNGFEYLKSAQKTFMEQYRIEDHDRWDWYQDTGKLVFSHQSKPIVECDIDFVGTLSSISDTWMWAWANKSFSENIKASSRDVRSFGEENSILKLASALWPSEPGDGWEMTAIMAKKMNAIGAYRTPDDNGYVYMIIKSAKWAN